MASAKSHSDAVEARTCSRFNIRIIHECHQAGSSGWTHLVAASESKTALTPERPVDPEKQKVCIYFSRYLCIDRVVNTCDLCLETKPQRVLIVYHPSSG